MKRLFIKRTAAFTAALMMSFVPVPVQGIESNTVITSTIDEAADSVVIDEAHFPDIMFRNRVCYYLEKKREIPYRQKSLLQ